MKRALLGDIDIDVLESESPEYANVITEKPVERGVDIADHVRPQPIRQSLSCVIAGPRAESKYQQLKQYQERGERLLFVSGLDVMWDMVIETLSPSRDAGISDGFEVDIVLKQVRVAAPEVEVYVAPDPAVPDPTEPAPAPRQEESGVVPEVAPDRHLGTQQPIEGRVDEQRRGSILMEGARWIGDVLDRVAPE